MARAIRHDGRKKLPGGHIRGIHYKKKRFRIISYPALIFSAVLFLIMAALALVCNQTGFDKKWYGDIITTLVCIIGFFALLNIGYVVLEGITVENGIVYFGKNADKTPVLFSVMDVKYIEVQKDGEPVSENWKRCTDGDIVVYLNNETTQTYHVSWLTRRKFEKIKTYFENGRLKNHAE